MIHLLYTVTTTAGGTLGMVPKPVQEVVCVAAMAAHHTEVAGPCNIEKVSIIFFFSDCYLYKYLQTVILENFAVLSVLTTY